MEDKQIYTTARSEEIKRQVKSYLEWFKGKYGEYNKRKKSKSSAPVKRETARKSEEKKQNVILSYKVDAGPIDNVKKENLRNSKEIYKGESKKLKFYETMTYVLFAVIIGIILLSVYLILVVK